MRDHDLAAQITTMPDGELTATRRDLATGISLMKPGSPLHRPATAYLTALDTELARRQDASARPPTLLTEVHHMDDTWETTVRTAATTMLRYPEKISDGLETELYALLEQLGTPETAQPASTGQPGGPGPFCGHWHITRKARPRRRDGQPLDDGRARPGPSAGMSQTLP